MGNGTGLVRAECLNEDDICQPDGVRKLSLLFSTRPLSKSRRGDAIPQEDARRNVSPLP